jgi:hypothetical protein
MTEIKIGNEYQSTWGLTVTVLNIRKTTGKRNILISYHNQETNRSACELLSPAELRRRYRYFVGFNETIAINAAHLRMGEVA